MGLIRFVAAVGVDAKINITIIEGLGEGCFLAWFIILKRKKKIN